jgi:hypothetical protein
MQNQRFATSRHFSKTKIAGFSFNKVQNIKISHLKHIKALKNPKSISNLIFSFYDIISHEW